MHVEIIRKLSTLSGYSPEFYEVYADGELKGIYGNREYAEQRAELFREPKQAKPKEIKIKEIEETSRKFRDE